MSSTKQIQPKMLFGSKLSQEIYEPWKEYYIDYNLLKRLLKENVILQDNWNDNDEQNFVSTLDSILEKVYSFQHEKYDELNEQLNKLQHQIQMPDKKFELNHFLNKLDEILSLAQELDKFQRLNYTGFVKIVKKHDRLHPPYNVKPLLNVRLKDLPFHSEDYSPLLYKISALFQFLRENYNIDQSLSKLSSFNDHDNSKFQSFKFWIHPDNLMEVKTTILRHLPVLVFNYNGTGSSNDDDDDDDDDQVYNKNDPIINCLYFDNANFEMYNSKLIKQSNSSSLRVKWIGDLSKVSQVSMEKKHFDPSSENFNINEKISIKPKNINSLIHNKLNFLKKKAADDVEIFKVFAEFIQEHQLEPVLRTVYKRTAFQIPGDDKIRITIDSNLLFIREDSLDKQRPIRDPSDWHRNDIDSNPKYQNYLRTGEYSKFPYSVMEIKIKRFSSNRKILWIEDLINSHLVKEVPNFSKFIHGISSLFLEDDNLDNIPFWFNELEQDIKIDPRQYFKEHNTSIQKINDDENLKNFKDMVSKSNNLNLRKSFSGALFIDSEEIEAPKKSVITYKQGIDNDDSNDSDFNDESSENLDEYGTDLGGADLTQTATNKATNKLDVDSEDEEIELPPGVFKPESYIKNAGPLKIEPKVWLANERTFNRWLHVTTLLSSITFIISSSANSANNATLSYYLAYFYFGLTLFSGVWGYYIFMRRREIIMERDAKHLDNMVGPLIVAAGLVFALIFNFAFGFKKIYQSQQFSEFYQEYPMHHKIHQFIAESIL